MVVRSNSERLGVLRIIFTPQNTPPELHVLHVHRNGTVQKILVHLSNVTFGFPLRMWYTHKNDILKIWNIFIKATNKCKQLFKYYILQIRVNTK